MRPLPSGTVTFLFSDIEGSTRLLEELGAEAYAVALAEHRRVMREAFAGHGGIEVDTQGDAFFVVFPEAGDALAAAAQAQAALAEGPIRVRMGIHSGEPLLTKEGYVGIDVHRGARVMAAGHGGQVLVSQETYRLLGGDGGLTELGRHRLKDLIDAQPLYQLGDDDFPPLKTLYQTNLPVQPTPLVGREAELDAVLDLLATTRLLTLTGAGGSGKTRLALQAAADVVDDYRDGVWWVSLAGLRDPNLVEPAIAQVVGAREGLAVHLHAKETLLLLDNFEQLLEAAPQIASLLVEAPDLRVLVTSRERLALSAEQEYSVPTLVSAEAVALFTARARQLKPAFEPDEHVENICRRLDGLPLALELAAARVKVLTPLQILERLGQSLALLTAGARDAPERQRTLRSTIEWSYELLSEDEQRLFPRLAVFAGGFSLEAAETVSDVGLDVLQSLVDKSLLRQTDEGRFFLLETIREFARDRLDEHASFEHRHAMWCVALAEDANRGVHGPQQSMLFDVLDREHNNLRAALDWAEREDHHELLLRLASSLGYFWLLRGHVVESRTHLTHALAAPVAAGLEPLRVNVLLYSADDARLRGNVEQAETLIEEATELARRCGNDSLIGRTVSFAGVLAAQADDFERSEELQRDALDHFRACADEWGEGAVLSRLTDLALRRSDFPRAERLAADSLDMAQRIGEDAGIGVAWANLALSVLEQRRPEEARRHAAAAIRHFTAVGEQEGTSGALELLAAAVEPAKPSDAARLLALATVLRDPLGTLRGPPEQAMMERILDRARARLGEVKFTSIFDSAAELDPAAAMAEAALTARALIDRRR
jgi:predicted ATPase